jgi:acyl carrier protein
MQDTNVENEIRNFVIANFLFGRDLDLQPGDSLLEKGVIDSTGVLELVAFLEEQYAIEVEDDEVTPDNLDSIECIAAYVGKKLNHSV